MNMCAYGTLGALDFFFVTENLHASASLYGFLGAAAPSTAYVRATQSLAASFKRLKEIAGETGGASGRLE